MAFESSKPVPSNILSSSKVTPPKLNETVSSMGNQAFKTSEPIGDICNKISQRKTFFIFKRFILFLIMYICSGMHLSVGAWGGQGNDLPGAGLTGN